MAVITRDELLGMTERVFDMVELPGDRKVRIRSLNEDERTRYEFASSDINGRWSKAKARDARALMIALSVVDDTGHRIYTAEDLDQIVTQAGKVLIDLEPLRRLNSTVASLIYAGCLSLHSKARIEDLEKNSEAATDSESPPDSVFSGE